MAASPKFKIYRNDEYIGSVKYGEDAAAMMFSGEGSEVRLGHSKRNVVWTEGQEEIPAFESYDRASEIMNQRVENIRAW